MIIDCDRCALRDVACGDCVVGVLLGVPGVRRHGARPAPPPAEDREAPGAVHLEPAERRALQVLADQGLGPTLLRVVGERRRAERPGRASRPMRDAG